MLNGGNVREKARPSDTETFNYRTGAAKRLDDRMGYGERSLAGNRDFGGAPAGTDPGVLNLHAGSRRKRNLQRAVGENT
jgi:hypothetical protein